VDDKIDQSTAVIAGVALFTAGALLLPVLIAQYPALVDFPAHLARHYIASRIGASRDLQTFYSYTWWPDPYLATDVPFIPLSAVFSPLTSERIIVGITIALWVLWPFVLYRALWKRWSAAPFLSGLIVFNAALRGGLENFLLAAAVAMFAFALWIVWSDRLSPWRIAIFCVTTTAVYLGHAFAWAILVLMIAPYELQKTFSDEKTAVTRIMRLLAAALQFVPALLLFLFFGTAGRTSGAATTYGGLSSRVDAVLSLVAMYDLVPDLIALTAIFGILIWRALKSNGPIVHPSMRSVLLAALLVCLLTPSVMLDVRAMHIRLPPVLVSVLIASLNWQEITVRQWKVIGLVFAVALALRSASVTSFWLHHEAEVIELRTAFQQLDRGALVLPTVNPHADTGAFHWFSSAYAVVDRDAYTPSLYPDGIRFAIKPAYARLTQLAFTPVDMAELPLPEETPPPGATSPWTTWWRDYSHLLVLSRTPIEPTFSDHLQLVADGSFFRLYKIRHQ
jgi:hypothetical protein